MLLQLVEQIAPHATLQVVAVKHTELDELRKERQRGSRLFR